MILGGAIWVAVAKSRVKHEHQDDLEMNGYVAVNSDEQNGKENEFELGAISEEEEDQVGSSLSLPQTPSRDRRSEDITKEDENLNVAGDGELSEMINWKVERRE